MYLHKIKVLLLSPLPPPMGGIATWTQKYMEYCDKKNLSVEIVNIAVSGKRVNEESGSRNIFQEIYRTKRILNGLIVKIESFHPDIIHLNSSCTELSVLRDLLCVCIAKIKKKKIMIQCRCNIIDQLPTKTGMMAFACLAKCVDGLIVLDRYSYQAARKYKRHNLLQVSNYIEAEKVSKAHVIRDKIEKIVYVGNFMKEKGAVEFIQAARSLPGITFTIVGPVKPCMKNIPLPQNVVLKGKVAQSDVSLILEDSDLFLFPSYTEGFSNALLEAMACGLPAVVTDVGANKEMIENKGGVIVPKKDAGAIVDAIHKLMDADIRTQMSEWNIQKVRGNYLMDQVMETLFGIYEKITNEGVG